MPIIFKWKIAVLKDQANKTGRNIYLQKNIKTWFNFLELSGLCESLYQYWQGKTYRRAQLLTAEKFWYKYSLTLGLQSDRRKFEKQPSHTIVKGAYAVSSSPALVLYCTPLIVPFSSSREVTVPCSNRTLAPIKEGITINEQFWCESPLENTSETNQYSISIPQKKKNQIIPGHCLYC